MLFVLTYFQYSLHTFSLSVTSPAVLLTYVIVSYANGLELVLLVFSMTTVLVKMSVCLLGSCYYTQANFSPISEISPKHVPLCSGRPRLQLLCSQDASADADQFSSGVKWGLLLRALLGTKPPDRGGGDGGSWRWVSQLLAIQTFTICLTAVIGNWHSEMGSGFLLQKHLVRNVHFSSYTAFVSSKL